MAAWISGWPFVFAIFIFVIHAIHSRIRALLAFFRQSPSLWYSCPDMTCRYLLPLSFLLATPIVVFPQAQASQIQTSQPKTFQPKTIQFQGDTEYTDAELEAAADLKPGSVFTADEINDHAKLLMDSGVFENISFNFHGQDLIFELVPSTDLYPLRLENLPIAGGKELNDRLHTRFPLFHGKVPTSGGLLDAVRKELESELAEIGIQATITTSAFDDPKADKITAMNFAVSSPPIFVGEIEVNGASTTQAEKARLTAAKAIGSAYTTNGSANQIETTIGNFYREQGYIKAEIHASQQLKPVVDADGVHIPFTVTISEGLQYKLLAVKLEPGLLITQTDFDKESNLKLGEVVSLTSLRQAWVTVARQYHNKGFMRAKILPTATLNLTQGTIAYSVAVDPGPVYTMGALIVANLSDDLRDAIKEEWKMPPGAVFNEGAIMSLTDAPSLAKIFDIADLRYTLNFHDDVRTVDVDLRLVRKIP